MMTPSAVYAVPWMSHDANLDGAVIIGRAHIDYPNGGRTTGLVVQRASGRREVVYFDRISLQFSTVPLP